MGTVRRLILEDRRIGMGPDPDVRLRASPTTGPGKPVSCNGQPPATMSMCNLIRYLDSISGSREGACHVPTP